MLGTVVGVLTLLVPGTAAIEAPEHCGVYLVGETRQPHQIMSSYRRLGEEHETSWRLSGIVVGPEVYSPSFEVLESYVGHKIILNLKDKRSLIGLLTEVTPSEFKLVTDREIEVHPIGTIALFYTLEYLKLNPDHPPIGKMVAVREFGYLPGIQIQRVAGEMLFGRLEEFEGQLVLRQAYSPIFTPIAIPEPGTGFLQVMEVPDLPDWQEDIRSL